MPRKRKVVVPEVVLEVPVKKTTEVHTIVQCTQKSETFHNKYLKDLQIVYANVSFLTINHTTNLIN